MNRNLLRQFHKAMSYGYDRLPRKLKKFYLGRKLNKNKLRKLLSQVVVVDKKTGQIEPYEFCPKCGSRATRSTGNMVAYPERWDRIYCERCGHLVCESDNSRYYHCLESPEYDYCLE